MPYSIPAGTFDPVVAKLGEVAGFLSGGDTPAINDAFLADPLAALAGALRDRQGAVIDLLGMVLGDTNAEVLGVPAGGTDDHWIPIRDTAGLPTGLYLVVSSKAGRFHVGLGWRIDTTEGDVTVGIWVHIPLLSTNGTTAPNGTIPEFATEAAPIRIAAEVTMAGGFGVHGLRFRGVRGMVAVKGVTAPPDVGLVLLGLEIGDAPAVDRSLADLVSLPAAAWIDTAVALFTAQLRQAGNDDAASIVASCVLPLLGITATGTIPRLRWEELPARGLAVFDTWFSELTNSGTAMQEWLGKWQTLLHQPVDTTIEPPAGSGTRADPWRAGVKLTGIPVIFEPTAALETQANGVRVLYLGLRVRSTKVALAAGVNAPQLELAASAEVVAIPIGSTDAVRGLPSLTATLRIAAPSGPLATHTFTTPDPLSALGTLRVDSIEAGLALNAAGVPTPHLALRGVECARGSWPMLDLTSADAILDGLGGIASNLIQQQIEQGLALATGGSHAGKRIAALLGLLAPTADGAPTTWPVPLASDASRITQFLGNPLAAVARYHAACLTTDAGGAPAWRFLLAEISELLRVTDAPATNVRGAGTTDLPWRVVVASTDVGALVLRATLTMDDARPQLRMGVVFEPRVIAVADASLSFTMTAELLHLDLAPADTVGAARGTWLPRLATSLQLGRSGGIETPSLGGLRFSADGVALNLQWTQARGASWSVRVGSPVASWDGARGNVLTLPTLELTAAGLPVWNLADANLGGVLGAVQRDAVAELCRFIVGHLALEHGGPVGFGLSTLLGLLPTDPGISMPDWRGASIGLRLPDDFPVLQPADWAVFFANPWPDVRAHLVRLMAEPRYTMPLLHWLSLALQGLAPRRAHTDALTFEEALAGRGEFPVPDAGLREMVADDAPLSFPSLERLPITVRGNGTHASPYRIGMRAPAARGIDALVWLDPDGPPTGSAIDVALQGLAPALRDLTNLEGVSLAQLLQVLEALGRIDRGIASALQGITPATLAASLTDLETFLRTSDGVALTASQQPTHASWVTPAPLEAAHVSQLSNASVLAAIHAQVTAWDGGQSLPVLMLAAPFERNAAWSLLGARLGAPSTAFSYRACGVSPHTISVRTLTGVAPLTTAELSAWDDAGGLTLAQRMVPVDATPGTSSQAEQVVRLVERLRELQPSKRVVIVAHSSSGLAARAAVQRAGMSAHVRGIITVGTPHVSTPMTWSTDPVLRDAVSALQRMPGTMFAPSAMTPALDALWQFLRNRDLTDQPLRWPAHAFQPAGAAALPAGIDGLAIATRLPGTPLRQALAEGIAARAAQLRVALSSRAPAEQLGFGLSLAPRIVNSNATLRVETSIRLDLAQVRVTNGGISRTLPRIVLHATLTRADGWLVGSPLSDVRVRWAEIGCVIGADTVKPTVTLHDVSVNGVEQQLATVRETVGGAMQPDDLVVPALNALLAELTTEPGANVDVVALAALLHSLQVTKWRGATAAEGYALNPDGWSGAMADARAYGQRVLADVIADAGRRTVLLDRLRAAFALSNTDLTRLLFESTGDTPAWRALRALLRGIGLLDTAARGSAPRLDAVLALCASPAAFMRTHVEPLVRDATRRSDLLGELRAILGVSDLTIPVADVALGGGLRLRVEALGRVSLLIDEGAAFTVGGAFTLGGRMDMDLRAGTASIALRLQPVGITTGFTWRAATNGTPLAWTIALDFSDGVRATPLDAVQLFPVPTDLATQLGRLLPRVTVSTIATALLDSIVLPQLPALGGPLQSLGLAESVTGGRPRLRNLSRLIADPAGWMLSPAALGTRAGTVDATRVAGLVRELMAALGLSDADGVVRLPLGLQLRTAVSPAAGIALTMDAPLDLGNGLTIAGDFAVSWTLAGALGAGGSLDLRAALPGSWPAFRAQMGVEHEAFRIALGADDAMIQLLPFAGFNAAALGTAAVHRLLPTLVDALMRAMEQSNPALVSLVTRLRTAANVLRVDTVAGLDVVRRTPTRWIRERFNSANAFDTLTAVNAIIAHPAFTVAPSGKLSFKPASSPVAVILGRNGSIGLGIEVTNLDLGPVTMSATCSVGIADTSVADIAMPDAAPRVVVTTSLDLRVDADVIAPAGVSITPSLHFAIGSDGRPTLRLYPIGNDPRSPDFVLDILPTFDFRVDVGTDGSATIAEALVTLARRVLVPIVIETFLDTPDVTAWLNTSIGTPADPRLRPGAILVSAGLLVNDDSGGYDLVALDTLTNPLRIVEGLVGAGLGAAAAVFSASPVIRFADPARAGDDVPGLYIVQRSPDAAPASPARLYGIRVLLPELRVSKDPEIIVRLGGRTDWIEAAGGPAGVGSGLTFLAIRDNGSGAPTRYDFDPSFTLAGVGLHVSGRGDEPLFDVNGFQLGGLEALLYLDVSGLVHGPLSVKFGVFGDVIHVAIPLGTSKSNPVAGSLLASSGAAGDKAPVNPKFSIRAAYVSRLWLEIGGEKRNEVWFPIQRTFGPVTIQQVGVRWIGGDAARLAILLDGGVKLAGLAVGVDDLSLTMPLARLTEIAEWKLGLRGLAVSYNGGGVKMAGGMLQASDECRYDGFILIEVGGKSFVAFGSYGVTNGEPSLFVFLVLGIPIGGPPYFFITGLAGGFGYNRGLMVPPIDRVPQFPLVSAMSNPAAVTDDPMAFLRSLGPSFPMERGSYWFAAGIKFTSFTLINSQALLYVLLNRGLEIGILGMSQAALPPAPAPALVNVELAIKARFSTIEGLISVEARLTDNSWLLSKDCRLTGGFAFFLWFAGEHAGDFVISVGGYHPRFVKPAHYPDVPRLGFTWRVGSTITIKGEAYFALTPREMMAGGLLEASYVSGDVEASFRVWANAFVQWKPFWFEFDGGVSIHVRADTFLGTVDVEVGADFEIWGAPVGGIAEVRLWVISFPIRFGASKQKPAATLSWDEFRTSLLPPENDKLFSGNVERGLISGSPAHGPWLVLPEFTLRTDVFIASTAIRFGAGAPATTVFAGISAVDVRPMQVADISSLHTVRVVRVSGNVDVTASIQVREERGGNVARALWDTSNANPDRTVFPALTGSRLAATFDLSRLDSTGAIKWRKLFNVGPRHPLPFARELRDRQTVDPHFGGAYDFDVVARDPGRALYAAEVVLRENAWAGRRAATLAALASEGVRVTPNTTHGDVVPRGSFRRGRRSSPPLVRSLYEGLNATPVAAADRVPVPAAGEVDRETVAITAALQSIIRQRVEPTRATVSAVRTTATSRAYSDARREIDMTTLLTAPIAGACVLRQDAATAPRETSIARRTARVSRGLQATTQDTALLDRLTAMSRSNVDGEIMTGTHDIVRPHVTDRAPGGAPTDRAPGGAPTDRAPGGAPVDAGSTLLWTLPTRDVHGVPPTLHLRGDAATRVTALDRAGAPLLDVETIGTYDVSLPPRTATLLITGLGRPQARAVTPALGAVMLGEATSAVPVVGWQSHMPLTIAGDSTLLARGAMLRLAAPLPARLMTGTIRASTALTTQVAVETLLPISVRAIAIVLDEGDESAGGTLAESLAVSARGASLSEAPIVVSGGSRTVLLFDVLATTDGATSIAIPVAVSDAWTLNGVLGLTASAGTWAELLTTADLDTLVENGPLSPLGSTLVSFTDSI